MRGKGEQPDLFAFGAHGDITARKHGGNAESEAAHKDVLPSASQQRELILTLLRTKPAGLTVQEISDELGMGYTSASARASELKATNQIRASGLRRETRSGSSAAVLVIY